MGPCTSLRIEFKQFGNTVLITVRPLRTAECTSKFTYITAKKNKLTTDLTTDNPQTSVWKSLQLHFKNMMLLWCSVVTIYLQDHALVVDAL